MEQRIFQFQCHPVIIISEPTPLADPLAAFQSAVNAETNNDDQQDNGTRTPFFKVVTCVVILPNVEASVSVKSSSTRFYLHDDTPEFDVKSNGLTGFRGCKCPAARSNEIMHHEYFEETNNIAERNAIRRRNQTTGGHCPPGLSCTQPQ